MGFLRLLSPLTVAIALAALGPATRADGGPPTAGAGTLVTASTQRVHYSLKGLRPLGISQYSVPSRSAQREYIHFENAEGHHHLIYEEVAGTPGLQEMQHFREVMGKWDMICNVDLDCKGPAFCVGSCRNLYYETSNTPEDLGLLDRNHCVLTSYRCEKPLPPPVTQALGGSK